MGSPSPASSGSCASLAISPTSEVVMSALLMMVLRSAAAEEADEGFWSSEPGFAAGGLGDFFLDSATALFSGATPDEWVISCVFRKSSNGCGATMPCGGKKTRLASHMNLYPEIGFPSTGHGVAVGGPVGLELRNVEFSPVFEYDVLVRVRAVSINTIDLATSYGLPSRAYLPSPPFVLGYDFSGEVLEVGPDVEGIRAGEDVFGVNIIFDGGTYLEYFRTLRYSTSYKN
ncbi:hypothetical protein NL676_024080 [Syzygium grande]|nr:hypothetical protein NL676_024080 [Syzygium grande]